MAKIRYAADQARIGARLDRMLQRIEETAAKTDRGRAIKTALGFVEAEQETEGLR
jgi:hypothetical protein